jgi:hypothetical protein
MNLYSTIFGLVFLQWPNFSGWTGRRVLAGPGSSDELMYVVYIYMKMLLVHQRAGAIANEDKRNYMLLSSYSIYT